MDMPTPMNLNFVAKPDASNDAERTSEAELVDRPPSIREGISSSKTYEPLSFPIIALLMPAAVFGALARLGLIALMTYDGNSVFPLVYVQAVGCLIMGFGLRLKEPLGQFYAPFYTALTTGFCGSLTTFSGWQLDIFQAWINVDEFKRSGFRNFVDGVGISAITLSLSLASLAVGYKVASVLAPRVDPKLHIRRMTRYSISLLAVLTYAATFVTYFLLPARYRHQATGALIFSFPGALTRYLLSIGLNQRFNALPAGTLAANALGTALLAAFHVLQSTPHPPSPNTCSLLQGLIDGYCGCLTTVSTFAAEVRDLRSWKACRYVLLSWLLGQAMILLIFGSSIWTGHASIYIILLYVVTEEHK